VVPPVFPGGKRKELRLATAHDKAVDEEYDDGSADGQEPGLDGEELLERCVEENATEEPAEQCADEGIRRTPWSVSFLLVVGAAGVSDLLASPTGLN
jgi:hypothetical protein